VTDASKGMGRSIAAILAQAGTRVVISSRNQADCDRVAAEISGDPGQCVGIASNIGDNQTLQTLVATTQSNVGKPDILVCNAAREAPIGSLEKVKASVFDEAMISNVRNNLLLVNLVAPDYGCAPGRVHHHHVVQHCRQSRKVWGRCLCHHQSRCQPVGPHHGSRVGTVPSQDECNRPDRCPNRFFPRPLGHS
jgi:NAD(P)-dependent dehydrogenase (short-subunit alcohol dehydrogenase family)